MQYANGETFFPCDFLSVNNWKKPWIPSSSQIAWLLTFIQGPAKTFWSHHTYLFYKLQKLDGLDEELWLQCLLLRTDALCNDPQLVTRSISTEDGRHPDIENDSIDPLFFPQAARYHYGLYTARRELEEAEKELDNWLTCWPNRSGWYRMARGLILSRRGQLEARLVEATYQLSFLQRSQVCQFECHFSKCKNWMQSKEEILTSTYFQCLFYDQSKFPSLLVRGFNCKGVGLFRLLFVIIRSVYEIPRCSGASTILYFNSIYVDDSPRKAIFL